MRDLKPVVGYYGGVYSDGATAMLPAAFRGGGVGRPASSRAVPSPEVLLLAMGGLGLGSRLLLQLPDFLLPLRHGQARSFPVPEPRSPNPPAK